MNKKITKEELLDLIRTNGWFSYKELMSYLKLNKNQIKYLLVDKYKIKLKEEFRKWLMEKFNNRIKPLEIHNEFKNIPLSTIYVYYREWRKDIFNKVDISKKQLIIRLIKCNYSLSCYKKRYNVSPDKVKRLLRDYGMLDWFLNKQKEFGLKEHIKRRKYKRGELKEKVFKLFDCYPNALNRSGSYLSNLFNSNARYMNYLKKKYKKEKGLI